MILGKANLLVSLAIILLITIIVWGKVLAQALIGEGFIYFAEPYLSMINSEGLSILWSRHDTQAILFFYLIRDVFRDNMKAYMGFLLLGSVFVTITAFFLIRKVTGSLLAATLASILFIANFIGSFEILGIGYYQWFIQRVPNFGLALIGLMCLYNFLQKKKTADYLLALVLYLLAVFLARYTIHILPLFALYIFFTFVISRDLKQLKTYLYSIGLILPFLIGSYILMKAQTLTVGDDNPYFFQDTLSVLQHVLSRLTYMTLPFLSPSHFLTQTKVASLIQQLYPFVPLLYILGTIFIFRRLKKAQAFILALVLSLPLSIYLSIYLNPSFLNYYESSRYLYYSSLLFSIFWGIVLWQVGQIRKIYLAAIGIFIILWFILNTYFIYQGFAQWQDRHNPVNATINYMQKNHNLIPENSAVLLPKEVGYYGSAMLQYYYPKDKTAYFVAEEEITGTYPTIIYLKYNNSSKKVEQSIKNNSN